MLATTFLQRSDGSPVSSATPQTGGGGGSSGNNRSMVSTCQLTIFMDGGGESVDGANAEKKGAHEASKGDSQERQALLIIGRSSAI